MGKTLKIWNEFGETPKVSYEAAGQDFMIPKLNGKSTEQKKAAMKAFEKSYSVTEKEINDLCWTAQQILLTKIGDPDRAVNNTLDVVHLFLALDSCITKKKGPSMMEKLQEFCDTRLEYDKTEDKVGLWMDTNDHLKINSGIHEVLPHGYAGIMDNKSGRGQQGFDVRAKVIDEDYTGLVHLNIAYTKAKRSPVLWCKDKIVQQLVLPIYQVSNMDEISEEEYAELMKDSARGSDGFGSTNNK